MGCYLQMMTDKCITSRQSVLQLTKILTHLWLYEPMELWKRRGEKKKDRGEKDGDGKEGREVREKERHKVEKGND